MAKPDRSAILDFLAMADRQIAEGERRIADQRRLLASLEKAGPAGSEIILEARQLLVSMESRLDFKHRDRLRKQLATEQ